MKRLLFPLLRLGGAHALLRARHRNELRILMYHGVYGARPHGIENCTGKHVSVRAFARQMRHLRAQYRVLPLAEALGHLARGTLPPQSAAVTFDDGYLNNFTQAFQVLRRERIPATIFVTTGFVDQREPLWFDALEYAVAHTGIAQAELTAQNIRYDIRTAAGRVRALVDMKARLKQLSDADRRKAYASLLRTLGVDVRPMRDGLYAPLHWQDIREMADSGLISIGCHTVTHPILPKLPPAALARELQGSKRALERQLRAPVRLFSYPNGSRGDINGRVVAALRAAGFSCATTTIEGFNRAGCDPFMLRRLSVDDALSQPGFELLVSGVLPALRRMRGSRE